MSAAISSDVDSALLDAQAFDLVEEKFGYRQSDNARYSIFEVKERHAADHAFDYLNNSAWRQLVARWATTNITVLELAATAHWLVAHEKVSDWETEIRRRKGAKTDGDRLEKAKALLAEVHLSPAA